MDDIQHCFERAGLGIAPFRCVRVEIRRYRACPDAPAQPGGTCDFCGAAIVECCIIHDRNGKSFTVGNDCVAKTGDNCIINYTKRELARLRKQERWERERQRIAVAHELLQREDIRAALDALPHPYADNPDFATHTLLSWALWMMSHAGNAGMMKVARVVEKIAEPSFAPNSQKAS